MPIDGERFRCRSPFLLIDLLTTMHPHRGFCLPNFFHTVLAQLAELQSPRCIYNIVRTLKASRRSCRPLQNRRRCREWPKTMQRKQKNRMDTRFLSIHAVLWLGAGYGTRTRRLLLGKCGKFRFNGCEPSGFITKYRHIHSKQYSLVLFYFG